MAAAPRSTRSSSPSWAPVPLAPVILLYGPDDYFAQRALDGLKKSFGQAQGDYELVSISARDYQAGQLTVLASPSLFDQAKLIRVDHLSAMSEAFLQDALAYLENPDPSLLLVLHHTGGNRGKKLLDKVRASKSYVFFDCKPLKTERERVDFLLAEFRGYGKKVSPQVAASLAAATQDTAELASAARQLSEDEPGEISQQTIEKYYGGRAQVTAFKVADAALAGQSRTALSLLRQSLEAGNDPIPLLAALTSKLRTIAKVQGLRGSSQQLAAELKMAPWQVEAAQREARRFSPQDLAQLLALLAQADAQLKGENLDARYPLEKAVLKVSQAAAAS